jgi:hypothetical protein
MRNLNLLGFLLLPEEEEVRGSKLVERETAGGEEPPRRGWEVEAPLPLLFASSAFFLSALAAIIDVLLASLRSL